MFASRFWALNSLRSHSEPCLCSSRIDCAPENFSSCLVYRFLYSCFPFYAHKDMHSLKDFSQSKGLTRESIDTGEQY